MRKNYVIILLSVIGLVGFFYRSYSLVTLPLGLFSDEANIGVIALSLFRHGNDDYGIRFPLFFQGFGDYRLPIPIYLQLPFVALFGLKVGVIRLTTAMLSTVTIFFSYKIGKEWLNEQLGILSALFLALSPWHIHLSRNAMEWSYPLFFIYAAIYFFTRGLHNQKYILVGTVFMTLSLYTYYSAIVVVPIFYGLLLMYLLATQFKKNYPIVCYSLCIFILLTTPMIIGVAKGQVGTRFKTVANSGEESKQQLVSKVPLFGQAYLSHFSPDFLFFNAHNREDITRHSVKDIGQISRYSLLFLPLAFVFLWKRKIKKEYRGFSLVIVTSLLLLYPVPGIFNENQIPLATRAIIGIIPFNFLLAFGAYYLLAIRRKSLRLAAMALFIIIIVTDSTYFTLKYFGQYRLYASDYWGWQYGYEPTLQYFKSRENEYDNLLITHRFNMGGEIFKFYNEKYNCGKCGLFSNPIVIDPTKKQLFAVRLDDITEAKQFYSNLVFKTVTTIKLPDGRDELYIGEFHPLNSF